MSDFRIDQISNQAGTAGPDIAGITTFSSTSGMLMPSGVTEYRGGRGRGLNHGGIKFNTTTNIIDYITISTAGNATDFGDTTQARQGSAMVSSSTRGVAAGGGTFGTPIFNIIDYITISSTGNAFDFGDLTVTRRETTGVSNSTRGVITGGYNDTLATNLDIIDYITIASLGNATTFGSLINPVREIQCGLCNSPTRGILAGGNSTPIGIQNVIQYITISTTGNAQDFGDLTEIRRQGGACSNSIRGLFGGGNNPTNVNIIDYVTITSLGDAIDFGDLSQTRNSISACSSSIRGVFMGGYIAPAAVNTIDFVTIASTGNASDFGDLTLAKGFTGACSDAHGGLGD